jgi:hypothetical protein
MPTTKFRTIRATSRRMGRQSNRDTGAEHEIRSARHPRGLRFRTHGHPLPDLRRATTVLRVGGAATMLVMSACGGGDNSSKSSAMATTAVPETLLGTYTMSLKASDLPPSPPPELTDQAEHWTMKITTSGAANEGPALELINDALGSLEQPALRVHGDRLVLQHEECASTSGPAPYTFVKSEYSWSIVGRHLRLSAVTVGCPDHVSSTLLTAEPWTRR